LLKNVVGQVVFSVKPEIELEIWAHQFFTN